MEEKDKKDKQERLRQTIVILRKLTQELGLPYESMEVQAVKERLDAFVQSGESWKGDIPFSSWGRIARLNVKDNQVELTLHAIRKR
jgi:hypothetical protein